MIQIRDPETYLNASNGLLNLPSPPSLKLFPTSLAGLFYRKSILSCPLWLMTFAPAVLSYFIVTLSPWRRFGDCLSYFMDLEVSVKLKSDGGPGPRSHGA